MAKIVTPENFERNGKILELYSHGLSYSEIAAKIGVKRSVVAGVIHRNGGGDRGGVKKPRQHMVGRNVGRLKVLEYAGRSGCGSRMYLCFCSCGTYKKVASSALLGNRTRSCGCLHQEQRRKVDADEVMRMHRELKWSPKSIAQALGIHWVTVYKTLRLSREKAA